MRVNLQSLKVARVYAAIGVIGIGVFACVSPPLESPAVVAAGAKTILVPQNLRNKVDILFMVDNSNSMDAMQAELQSRFPQFFQPFIDLANKPTGAVLADLNIGVVTSDYGAGSTGAPGCGMSPGGQQGQLQARGVKADASCKNPLPDPTTNAAANYIHVIFGANGTMPTSNLPPMQDLVTTFTCMASVGSAGCGFEHQLESVYAALHNNLPANANFLRSDALLVVVFLTNEDDASAPPDTDIFDKNKVGPANSGEYGYEDSYSRQTRFAILCGNPLAQPPYGDSGGPLQNCESAPNFPTGAGPGKQYDISRYTDFFTQPPMQGGVKVNPLDVVLVGIDGPETPFQVILSNPGTAPGTPYTTCPQLNEASNPPCVPVLQHSCQNPAQMAFFGDPAVRLNTVIRKSTQNQITSICDNDYTTALQNTASLIVSNLGGGCIPTAFPPDTSIPTCTMTSDCGMNEVCGIDPKTSANACLKTDCTVTDITANADGTMTNTPIPQCPNNGPNPGTDPCWRIESKGASCNGESPNDVGLTIDRAGMAAPDHTTASVSCAFSS